MGGGDAKGAGGRIGLPPQWGQAMFIQAMFIQAIFIQAMFIQAMFTQAMSFMRGDSGAGQRVALVKPAAWAASSVLNHTSVIVRSKESEPGTWYFIERGLPLIEYSAGAWVPTKEPSP